MEIRYFLFKVFNSYRVKFLYNDCNLFRIVFKIYKTCILYRKHSANPVFPPLKVLLSFA